MNPEAIKVACSNCNLRELCMPMGLSEHDLERLDDLVTTRRKVIRGTTLFSNVRRFTPFALASSKPAWPRKMGATKSRASKWQAKSLASMAS
jgi:hypothetical protein